MRMPGQIQSPHQGKQQKGSPPAHPRLVQMQNTVYMVQHHEHQCHGFDDIPLPRRLGQQSLQAGLCAGSPRIVMRGVLHYHALSSVSARGFLFLQVTDPIPRHLLQPLLQQIFTCHHPDRLPLPLWFTQHTLRQGGFPF